MRRTTPSEATSAPAGRPLRRLQPSPGRLDRSLRAFRLIALIDADPIAAQVQIHGWDADTAAWRWMDLDNWTVPSPGDSSSSDDIAADLAISALERGWDLEAETLLASMPAPVASVQIASHSRVLDVLATSGHRADAGLLNLLAELPPAGAPGHVPWNLVASMFGLERRTVAAMRRRMNAVATIPD